MRTTYDETYDVLRLRPTRGEMDFSAEMRRLNMKNRPISPGVPLRRTLKTHDFSSLICPAKMLLYYTKPVKTYGSSDLHSLPEAKKLFVLKEMKGIRCVSETAVAATRFVPKCQFPDDRSKECHQVAKNIGYDGSDISSTNAIVDFDMGDERNNNKVEFKGDAEVSENYETSSSEQQQKAETKRRKKRPGTPDYTKSKPIMLKSDEENKNTLEVPTTVYALYGNLSKQTDKKIKEISESKATISTVDGNKTKLSESRMTIRDTDENKTKLSESRMTIRDTDENKTKLSESRMTIRAANKTKNNVVESKSVMSADSGSPGSHTSSSSKSNGSGSGSIPVRPTITKQIAIPSKKESEVTQETDKRGAIMFKVPGKLTHKTTIKVSHFPHKGFCEECPPCGEPEPCCDTEQGFYQCGQDPQAQAAAMQQQMMAYQQYYSRWMSCNPYGYNPYSYGC